MRSWIRHLGLVEFGGCWGLRQFASEARLLILFCILGVLKWAKMRPFGKHPNALESLI
jgi:hypothetical protein